MGARDLLPADLLDVLTDEERAELAQLVELDPTPWRPLPGPQSQAYYSLADVIGYGGSAGGGKGLALDTLLPTPDGCTTIGQVQPGDQLLDETGNPCQVTAVSEINHRACYRLTFDDGSVLVADDVHRWVTLDAGERAANASTGTMRNTRTLAATLFTSCGSPNHAIRQGGGYRYLLACDPVPTVPTRCLAVDSQSRQYLAGESMIPTHNTDLACGKAITQHQVALVLRREATQLTGIIDRFTELFGGRDGYNGQSKIWRRPGLQVEFGSVQYPDDWSKYQGRPHDLLVFDEAANFLEGQVRALLGWLRSVDPDQRCQALLTFNPPTSAEGRWIIDFFGPWLDRKHPHPAKPGELRWFAMIDGKEVEVSGPEPIPHDPDPIIPQSRTFIPSRISDNPYLLNTGYMSTLQALPEPLRSQMLYGDFQAGMEDDPWQTIPTEWVEAAQERWRKPAKLAPMDSLGVDVARGGKDSTILARRHGMWFDEPLAYPGAQTPDGPTTAGLCIAALRDHAVIHIDVIGVGSAPYDYLRESQQIIGVNVAEAATATDRSGRLGFRNMRSQLWWKMREALDPSANTGICLPPSRELLADLCAPRWKVQGSVIQVESREEIIKRIGRSPDYGSAYTLALIDTPKIHDLELVRGSRSQVREFDPYSNVTG